MMKQFNALTTLVFLFLLNSPACNSQQLTHQKTGQVQTFEHGVQFQMIWCPPGQFEMGSLENEVGRDQGEALHRVTLTQGFWIGQTEVTQAQWRTIMGDLPDDLKGNAELEGPLKPVVYVSWNDVQLFIRKLNDLAGKKVYRLPTEAEWEYACRAGTTSAYGFGPNPTDLTKYGNFCDKNCPWSWKDGSMDDGFEQTASVMSFMPNDWNLYDMHGNVWEWRHDWSGAYSGDATDPKGPDSGERRVFRGGSWQNRVKDVRSADRSQRNPNFRDMAFGFRLVRSE